MTNSANEHQERAYVAASRRSDRSLEARLRSALMASDVHKQRTGRAFRITEEIVAGGEMYEEQDDSELRRRRLGDAAARQRLAKIEREWRCRRVDEAYKMSSMWRLPMQKQLDVWDDFGKRKYDGDQAQEKQQCTSLDASHHSSPSDIDPTDMLLGAVPAPAWAPPMPQVRPDTPLAAFTNLGQLCSDALQDGLTNQPCDTEAAPWAMFLNDAKTAAQIV